jgi:hypothetical protein
MLGRDNYRNIFVSDHGGLHRVEASSLATLLLTGQPFCDRDGLTRHKETAS